MRRLKTGKIVLIKWIDAQSIDMGGIFCKREALEVKPIFANIVGFVVADTEKHYCLAREKWGFDQFKYLHIIPKRSVIEVLVLK